jgi:hypothetical protein
MNFTREARSSRAKDDFGSTVFRHRTESTRSPRAIQLYASRTARCNGSGVAIVDVPSPVEGDEYAIVDGQHRIRGHSGVIAALSEPAAAQITW